MNSLKLHTPIGVKDYTSPELFHKKVVLSKIENIFYSYAYEEVSAPTLEYLEVFERSTVKTKDFYKLVDRDGEVLTLRPDFTPPIARIASTYYETNDLPLRFFYIGNTFKYSDNYQGKDREITQAGIELIGLNDRKADSEAILIAIKSVLETGISDFKLDIGNVKFLDAILDREIHTYKKKDEILKLLVKGDYVLYENFINSMNLIDEYKKFLINIPTLIGDVEFLKNYKKQISAQKAIDAIDELIYIYEYLEKHGLEKYVRFDLAMIGKLNYYTGVIFEGYSNGVGYAIVNGGRYDNLTKEFGKDFPSVGFAININGLMEAIKKLDSPKNYNVKQHVLVMSNSFGEQNLIQVSNKLRQDGIIVENYLKSDSLEQNIDYAKNKGIDYIYFFKEDNTIDKMDINLNEISTIKVNELMEG